MNQVRAAFAIEHDEINTQIIDRLTAFGIIRGNRWGADGHYSNMDAVTMLIDVVIHILFEGLWKLATTVLC